MDSKVKEINNNLIQTIGLELDSGSHLIDQDTGQLLHFNGKSIKYNNTNINRLAKGEIEFDPVNNTALANYLCGYYIEKLNTEDEASISIYSQSNKTKDTIGFAEARQDDEIIRSDNYNRDSLKYIDLITKLDSTDCPAIQSMKSNIDLHEYDQVVPKKKRR